MISYIDKYRYILSLQNPMTFFVSENQIYFFIIRFIKIKFSIIHKLVINCPIFLRILLKNNSLGDDFGFSEEILGEHAITYKKMNYR